jgi:5-(carboxyamino)imidazole ribonucleotide mutase
MTVGIVMGSSSDSEIMDGAAQALREFDVQIDVRVLSAHRTPDDTLEYARTAVARGQKVLIAGAGGAAHLAGVLAAATPLPIIAVPIALANLGGLDSLLSMVQMPRGVPVATVAINGARNAGLLAVRILALSDSALAAKLESFRDEIAEQVRTQDQALRSRYAQESG